MDGAETKQPCHYSECFITRPVISGADLPFGADCTLPHGELFLHTTELPSLWQENGLAQRAYHSLVKPPAGVRPNIDDHRGLAQAQ